MSIDLWPGEAPWGVGTEQERPTLTSYPAKDTRDSAAVIVCPGGGYSMRADHEGEPVALWLNKQGISAFVLNYRVAPHRHPAPLSDAQRAIRYVRSRAQQLNVDPGRIGILGFSAGGHLAATAGTQFSNGNPDSQDPIERVSCRPDLMVLCYPVITLLEPYLHRGSRDNLLGSEAPGELESRLSGELQVTDQTPPAFIWHTADDEGVPVENSLLFAGALSRCKVPFDLHCYESGRHGIGLAEEHPQAHTWTRLCELWLNKRGFTPAQHGSD